ncbi:MAG: endospore germination permease [Syntrophomonadaceae bacterium]|nr:endospore germination permease [Syntrophomonadaceae bacterium]
MKMTNFQLFCLLLLLIAPVAYLETPHLIMHTAFNNSWLAALVAIIPGLLLVYMYCHIINKSSQPFPLLLNEHLGIALGKILGVAYIFLFILVTSYTLRLFIEFMKMNVLPATPISVFIGVLLFIGFAAIKTGLENIARVSEILVLIGVPFSYIIVIIAIANNFHIDRLLPVGYINYKSFGMGVLLGSYVLGKMMPVLSLAFLLDNKKEARNAMNKALFVHIPLTVITALGLVVTLGTIPSLSFTFPTFNMVRLARVGIFVQNLDIIFISIWIMGIFAAVTIPWFMACFVTQKVFNLRDYRFLAAPSTLIIGIFSITISRNNLETLIWSMYIIPPLYSIFFIGIPFIIFIITLFKPYPEKTVPEPIDQS